MLRDASGSKTSQDCDRRDGRTASQFLPESEQWLAVLTG
jgi:hypothetical protein